MLSGDPFDKILFSPKLIRCCVSVMRFSVIVKACFFLSFVFLISNSALADEVYLKNGDLLTGEILSTEEEKLIVRTSYSAEIKVNWQEVICVSSDDEVTLLLKNNEKLTGRVTCPSLGQIQFVNTENGELRELSITDLQAINPPPPPPPWTYKAVVDVGGAFNNGNTDTKTFNSTARFQARSEQHRIFAHGKYNWGESDGGENKNNWLLGGKYDYFFTKKVYAYLRPIFEYDKFQDLNLRSILGAGPGYQFIETENTSLFTELGLAYTNEDYEVASDKEYLSGRWSVGSKLDIIPDRVKFFHFQEGYYDLTSDEGLYLRTVQGFRLPIFEGFFFNIEFDWSYKSDPPPENKKSDTALIFGLGYELNF